MGMNSSARKPVKSACADSGHRVNWAIMELFGGLERIAYISPVVMIDLVLYVFDYGWQSIGRHAYSAIGSLPFKESVGKLNRYKSR